MRSRFTGDYKDSGAGALTLSRAWFRSGEIRIRGCRAHNSVQRIQQRLRDSERFNGLRRVERWGGLFFREQERDGEAQTPVRATAGFFSRSDWDRG
jgi:hypothetical protein